MPKKTKLVKRTYRIEEHHDRKVKRHAKKRSESQVIRDMIGGFVDKR